jgi:2-iminobutanoate/2-iminopropanoate deaminase
MKSKSTVYTGTPIEKKYEFSPGVVTTGGRLLFTSGQAGWDENGKIVGNGDHVVQARKAFDNLRAVVEKAGGKLEDVVKVTEYITDLSLYREIGRFRKEYFPANFPAATLVEVKGLWAKGQVFEIEAIAVIE